MSRCSSDDWRGWRLVRSASPWLFLVWQFTRLWTEKVCRSCLLSDLCQDHIQDSVLRKNWNLLLTSSNYNQRSDSLLVTTLAIWKRQCIFSSMHSLFRKLIKKTRLRTSILMIRHFGRISIMMKVMSNRILANMHLKGAGDVFHASLTHCSW